MTDNASITMVASMVLGYALVAAGVGAWISKQRNRDPNEGGFLGLVLGPIGWIIAGMMPDPVMQENNRILADMLAAERNRVAVANGKPARMFREELVRRGGVK